MKIVSLLRGLLFCTVLLTSFPTEALAGDCPRCHGRGRIQTQVGVSSYGTSVRYKICPNCGKRIMANEAHYDDCPVCGGSGSRSSASSSRRGRGGNDNELLSRLSPADAVRYQNLAKRLYEGIPVPITCDVCKGSGNCTYCNGYHNLDLDATADMRCRVCGGDGFCIKCRGKGNLGTRYEQISEQERQSILAQMKSLSDEAYGTSSNSSPSGSAISNEGGGISSASSQPFSASRHFIKSPMLIIAGLGFLLVAGLVVIALLLLRMIRK